MRTMIWSSTAMVVLIGAGLFVAAQHAVRHPDSIVGRCAMAVYRLCDPLIAPGGDSQHASAATTALSPVAAAAASVPFVDESAAYDLVAGSKVEPADAIEPIVIAPSNREPPLAFPTLSLELSAAIERLRGEEESEAPPKAFDSPPLAKLRMPYADEDTEVLPALTPEARGLEFDMNLPGGSSYFFLPPACWPAVFLKAIEGLR